MLAASEPRVSSGDFMNLPNSLNDLRIFFRSAAGCCAAHTANPILISGDCPYHFEVWGVLILLVAAATDRDGRLPGAFA